MHNTHIYLAAWPRPEWLPGNKWKQAWGGAGILLWTCSTLHTWLLSTVRDTLGCEQPATAFISVSTASMWWDNHNRAAQTLESGSRVKSYHLSFSFPRYSASQRSKQYADFSRWRLEFIQVHGSTLCVCLFKKVHKCKFVPFLREVGVRGFTRKMAHMGHGQADTPRTSFQGKGTKCVCTNRIKTCAFEVRVRGRTSKTIKHAFITLVNKMSLPRVVLRISRASWRCLAAVFFHFWPSCRQWQTDTSRRQVGRRSRAGSGWRSGVGNAGSAYFVRHTWDQSGLCSGPSSTVTDQTLWRHFPQPRPHRPQIDMWIPSMTWPAAADMIRGFLRHWSCTLMSDVRLLKRSFH